MMKRRDEDSDPGFSADARVVSSSISGTLVVWISVAERRAAPLLLVLAELVLVT